MKRKTMVVILRLILIGCLLCCLLFFFGFLPFFGEEIARETPGTECFFWPCLIWAWVFSLPFYVSFVLVWQIFGSIKQEGGAFCEKNSCRFRLLAYMAWSAALIFLLGMIILAHMGGGAPTLTLVATPLTLFIGFSVGFACYVMSRLVGESARLRQENELTI